ncbi:MAG TPA: tripartite tricarboxylate transporter TctB family protein [Anaerolineales bacterium]|nr:tripartite tricarboxylate transporter TctB family protein [Anaerolineales bacterium]
MIERVLILLTSPPGNIAYFLVLMLSIAGTFHCSWEKRRKPLDSDFKGLMLCLAILAGTILLPFVLQIMISSGTSIPQGAYHLVEDACVSIGTIWIIKCWLDFEHQKMKVIIPFILTGILAVSAIVIGLVFRQSIRDNLYQHSIPDLGWHIVTAILIAAALFILFIKRRKGFWLGAFILGLLMAGQLLYLVTFYQSTDPIGTIRLFQLLSFPIMLAHPITHPSRTGNTDQVISDQLQYDVYDALVQPIVALMDSDREEFREALVGIMSKGLGAESGILIQVQNDESLIIQSGWDLITRGKPSQSIEIDGGMAGVLRKILSGNAVIMEGSQYPELQELIAHIFGIAEPGSMLVAPIPEPEKSDQPEGFIFLNPHSKQPWTEKAVSRAENYCLAIGPFYHFHCQQADLTQAYEQANIQIRNATEEIKEFREVNPWFADRDFENLSLDVMVKRLLKEIESLRNTVEEIQTDKNKEKAESLELVISQYQAQFKLLLGEVARLKKELEASEKKGLQSNNDKLVVPIRDENLSQFYEKIRQPLIVIIGYTDRLLSESMGSLGENQFKYLYKIKASSLSIKKTLDEISKGISVQNTDAAHEFYELDSLIDRAIMLASGIMKEKRIALQLESPTDHPKLQISCHPLQEIINQLFMITSDICSENGVIKFQLKFIPVDAENQLQIRMSKIGGGPFPSQLAEDLAITEQSQTEERPVRSDLQQRVKVLRSLVYELEGRTWSEDLPSGGFTINVLLPCVKEESIGKEP